MVLLKFMQRYGGLLAIFLGALILYYLAGRMEEVPIPGQLGPSFWPKIVLLGLMIGCGIKSLEIFLSERRKAVEPQEGVKVEMVSLYSEIHWLKLAALMAIVLGSVYLIQTIGFLFTSLIFLPLFMAVAGMRKILPLFLCSILGTVLLLYIFVKVVYLPLPKGKWIFEDLTIYFYRLLRII